MPPNLPPPRLDLPFLTGRYSVLPGLSKLGPDRAIELDTQTPLYLAEKKRLLSIQPHEHVVYDRFAPDIAGAALETLSARLRRDWPGYETPYADFEGLCAAIPEDVAVVRRDAGRTWTCALHVCFPNGWSPREKIGLDFAATHAPVPGMKAGGKQGDALTDLMIRAESGLQRFVRGLRTDRLLDHRPEVPSPPWSSAHPDLFLRVERQVILGLPHVQAAVFLIRTYLTPAAQLPHHALVALADAVETLPPDAATYKGLSGQTTAIARHLRQLAMR